MRFCLSTSSLAFAAAAVPTLPLGYTVAVPQTDVDAFNVTQTATLVRRVDCHNSRTATQWSVQASRASDDLELQRGDLATFAASCIVTSANDSLVGTLQPTYWRFIARHSVDGSLREAAGPELDEACLQIEPVQAPHCRGIRRDITRWTGGVKHGASAPVRCDS